MLSVQGGTVRCYKVLSSPIVAHFYVQVEEIKGTKEGLKRV